VLLVLTGNRARYVGIAEIGSAQRRRGPSMRILTFTLGIIAIIGAATFVASRTTLAPSQATVIGTPQSATVQGSLISPFEMMMIKRDKPMPVESFDAH
jgi:hypothetical protein